MAAMPYASPGNSSCTNKHGALKRYAFGGLARLGELDQLGTPGGIPRQCQKGRVEVAFARLVGQRRAVDVQHFPTSTFEHALGSSGIPLGRGRQAWIAVGQAFGQLAELQRTADAGQHQLPEALPQPSEQALLR